VDFIFVDSEHVPQDRIPLSWLCQAYAAMGVPPVVRIPNPSAYEACRVLDGGASGIISPYTETVNQARAVAGAARYRPLKGRRMAEAFDDPQTMEEQLRTYLEQRNADTILILNIESVPGIENLEAILRNVVGIDAVLIGPHDLSCSLGIPEQYDHPRFDEAVHTIIRAARRRDVGAGIHYWQNMEQEIEWCKAGANLVMHAADFQMVACHMKQELDQIREALGEAPRAVPSGEDVV
jgi:4-hydroxy-2-oxoheptanedioate aldolase